MSAWDAWKFCFASKKTIYHLFYHSNPLLHLRGLQWASDESTMNYEDLQRGHPIGDLFGIFGRLFGIIWKEKHSGLQQQRQNLFLIVLVKEKKESRKWALVNVKNCKKCLLRTKSMVVVHYYDYYYYSHHHHHHRGWRGTYQKPFLPARP